MRLVEGVVGEGKQDVPHRGDGVHGIAVRLHAARETLELLVEFGFLLLAHRAPQQVGLTEGETSELLGDRHHLFLVDDQAVGVSDHVGERLLKLLVDRNDLLLPSLAERVVRVRVGAHGTGSV